MKKNCAQDVKFDVDTK